MPFQQSPNKNNNSSNLHRRAKSDSSHNREKTITRMFVRFCQINYQILKYCRGKNKKKQQNGISLYNKNVREMFKRQKKILYKVIGFD